MFRDLKSSRSKQVTKRPCGVQINVHWIRAILDMELPIPAVSKQSPECVVRNQGIHVDIESATGAEHAEDFLDDLTWLITVMEDAVRIHVVEGSIGKREASSIGLDDRRQVCHALPRPPQ